MFHQYFQHIAFYLIYHISIGQLIMLTDEKRRIYQGPLSIFIIFHGMVAIYLLICNMRSANIKDTPKSSNVDFVTLNSPIRMMLGLLQTCNVSKRAMSVVYFSNCYCSSFNSEVLDPLPLRRLECDLFLTIKQPNGIERLQ